MAAFCLVGGVPVGGWMDDMMIKCPPWLILSLPLQVGPSTDQSVISTHSQPAS